MMTDLGRSAAEILELAATARLRPAIDLALDLLVRGCPLERIVLDVLAPAQQQVGLLWEANRWGVADEHAATAVIDAVLGALALETSPGDPHRGEVLVACAEGEHHAMPARMGVELLRAQGWEVTFLGGSLPADDLQRFAAQRAPDVVVISCTVPLFLPGARRSFTAVAELGIPALAAGAAFGVDSRRAVNLGASSRLDPERQLADQIADHPDRDTRTRSAPHDALVLELDRASLQDACLSAMAGRLPATEGHSFEQLDSTRRDVGFILGFLAAAVDADDEAVFGAFVGWLAGVLDSRQVPSSVLSTSLSIIGEVVADAGLDQAARICRSSTSGARSSPGR